MSKIVLICIGLLAYIIGLNAQSTNSYWEEVKNPDGGSLYTTTVTNDGICYNYYDDGGPVYRTANKGESWEKIVLPYWGWDTTLVIGPKGDFYRVCQRQTPQLKYALNHSTDFGKTWVSITEDFPGVYLSQMRSGTLLATQTNDTKKIYRSTDGGKTWTLSASGGQFDNNEITDWGNGLLMTHNLSKRNFTYYSIDDGQTWSVINVNLPGITNDDVFLAKGVDTFFVARGYNLYRSYDRGNNWTPVFSHNNSIQDIFKTPGGKIFIIDQAEKQFMSDNNGDTWNPYNVASVIKPYKVFAVFDEYTFLGEGSDIIGIVKSDNIGKNWRKAAKNYDRASINNIIFADNSTLYALTQYGISKSDNKGLSWKIIREDYNDGLLLYKQQFDAINADTFAFLSQSDYVQYVTISTDGGITFKDYSLNGVTGAELFFHPKAKRLYYTNGYDTIYYSDNLGIHWQKANTPLQTTNFHFHPSGKFYGIDPFKGRLLTFDQNFATVVNITPQNFNIDHLSIYDISKNGHICVGEYPVNGVSKLAFSEDEGKTWKIYKIPYKLFKINSLEINDLGHVFLSFQNTLFQNFMIASSDYGGSWYNIKPSITGITKDENLLFLSPDGFLYTSVYSTSLFRSKKSTHLGGYIRGKIQKDADAECSTPDAQDPLKWPVTIEGEQTFYVTPNAQTGKYEAFIPDTGMYEVSVRPSNPVWWDVCDALQTVHLDSNLSADTADFAALAALECALMQVDISAPRLRRCSDNPVYVHYCNIGSEAADSAYVDIQLDPFLSMVSSPRVYTSIGPNTYRFQLGKVVAEACDDFHFVVNVDCDSTVLGQTHCIEAHAWPDTLCNTLPSWSGANIEAAATCLGDSIRLTLKNNSPVSSQSLEYVIVEDDVVLRGGPKQYGPFEEMHVVLPAMGRTMRIESKQEPNHPFSTLALAFKEGCNGFNSLGFVNQFAVNGSRPAYDVFCAQNVGAYDPNDKTGFPLGYGPQNRIRPGQDLEYMIRFQNTGTDTAFTVVIRDTLSEWLDPASVVPGASSHPYTWTLSGNGVLNFRFDQIMLPDSHKNVAASQGFISFKVEQATNVPLGAKIRNKAAIYFDFNAPIVTNQTLHTVQIQQITSTDELLFDKNSTTTVSPNPMREHAIIRLNNGLFKDHQITLTDILGRVVRQQRVTGSQYSIERALLIPGIYAYKVENKQGDLIGAGKLLVE